MNAYLASVIESVKVKHANEPEFVQTVEEVLTSLEPVINAHPEYEKAALLERMVEPERVVEFRVTWEDDNHEFTKGALVEACDRQFDEYLEYLNEN